MTTTTKKARTTAKSTVAALAAQIMAAPVPTAAPAAPKARTAPDLVLKVAKAFKPRTNQLVDKKADGKGNFAQENNWAALVAAVDANNGEIAYGAAVAAVLEAAKANGYEKTCNARGFVQGRVRNGHLAAI